jgi:hypothetical protein
MTDDTTHRAMDWPQYVKAMAALHRLALDPTREPEVVLQMQRIHALAQLFLDFPLAAEIDPAPTFRP